LVIKVVVLALSKSGENTARSIAEKFDIPFHGRIDRVKNADVYFSNSIEHIRDLFLSGYSIIGVCASGILIRAIAPFISNKEVDPAVVSVAEDGSVVVPLLGGHYGANRLAREISNIVNGVAAVTTAGDIALGVALDEPPIGYFLQNRSDAKNVMMKLLSGTKRKIIGTNIFDLTNDNDGDVIIEVTSKPTLGSSSHLVYNPKNCVIGLGCARNADPEELWNLVESTLSDANLAKGCVAAIASIDLKADEIAINEVAKKLNIPLLLFTADQLEKEFDRLRYPSKLVFEEVGSHGVSEGAALACVGQKGSLIVPKNKTKSATIAISGTENPLDRLFGRPRGRVAIVGIGPGQSSWRTPEATQLIADSEELVGYSLYLDLLGPLAFGKDRSDFPLGGEEERCRYALERAGQGKKVSLICSGDAGIYAMGALVFELLDRSTENLGVSDAARRSEIVCTPGVSALQGAAARAGAPLGHDFCAISLSDLLTPREDILRRIEAAAYGDFVIAFYNPVSLNRRTLLKGAKETLLKHRPATTPVLLAKNLGRKNETLLYRKLEDLRVDEVDMLTVVIVGSSNSKILELGDGSRMYTPRGYARKIDGDLA
jgi:cobalt-precorrin 5A hydrolase/precorrin-3B C17-methyltransferase